MNIRMNRTSAWNGVASADWLLFRSCSSLVFCCPLRSAHRLNTIMESDRIMVLDKGFLAEFDTPANLISRPESLFRRMVETADGVQADQE
jgi:hypothetical protein